MIPLATSSAASASLTRGNCFAGVFLPRNRARGSQPSFMLITSSWSGGTADLTLALCSSISSNSRCRIHGQSSPVGPFHISHVPLGRSARLTWSKGRPRALFLPHHPRRTPVPVDHSSREPPQAGHRGREHGQEPQLRHVQDLSEALPPPIPVTRDEHDLGVRVQLQELWDEVYGRQVGDACESCYQLAQEFEGLGLFSCFTGLVDLSPFPPEAWTPGAVNQLFVSATDQFFWGAGGFSSSPSSRNRICVAPCT